MIIKSLNYFYDFKVGCFLIVVFSLSFLCLYFINKIKNMIKDNLQVLDFQENRYQMFLVFYILIVGMMQGLFNCNHDYLINLFR